mmetsp:Transcript_15583/g.20301  ORF Transcript_15583/g.20301 Transcript_15583/m.20301 type:complete len:492 (+) Transcript_15583:265-1740(+)|eukprot:CAMPEP_0198150634 /NCGR_PEP_ID=MMETSP1443-20131203/51783_1 /TAXON_ID=186043 /ORGANISM="Entomoneis sp., Strain CCMP2396" /LENGTH=491 /DNA_ID=CAMNT_0043816005 /DNA_START=173 /DNA_END=1648 /DNA_ORIENTATION=-
MQGYKRRRGVPATAAAAASSCLLLLSVATKTGPQVVSGFQQYQQQPTALRKHFKHLKQRDHDQKHAIKSFPVARSWSETSRSRSSSRLHMSSAAAAAGTIDAAAAAAGVTVRLDQPLMPTHHLFTAAAGTTPSTAAATGATVVGKAVSKVSKTPVQEVLRNALAAVWESKIAKMALATFCLALVFSLSLRLMLGSSQVSDRLAKFFKLIKGRLERMTERYKPVTKGIPMPFEDENDGWGVCALKARKRLGKTNFMQFDFELPQPEYTVPLDLGQQLSLCCLDNDGNVARGSFFPFYKDVTNRPGSFSILAPNIDGMESSEQSIFRMGLENANFIRVMKHELKIGDEVALTLGDHRLSYKGQYLPVTDMVYIAYGTGIVPVLDQVRSVLPSGASSVSSVTVVWINETTRDFDVLAELLEKEYFKYSEKLAVSCIVGNVEDTPDFSSNDEINTAIPDFRQGTMAVLAGPSEILNKASFYLEDRGYPLDTICIL